MKKMLFTSLILGTLSTIHAQNYDMKRTKAILKKN